MTPVHPRQGEGVAEAVSRLEDDMTTASPSPIVVVAQEDLRLILSALSSQAEALEAMAGALEPFAGLTVLEPNGVVVGLERYHFDRARTALSTYRQTKEDTA